MAIDFDAPFTNVVSPSQLAHVVLRTSPSKFPELVEFYQIFLGAKLTYENEFIAFITYDEEHHRIAIVSVPETGPKNPETSGLHHIAFTFKNLEELALAYVQRKKKGYLPSWCVNHGTTMSMYYKDPDGNHIETQVDNCSPEEANEIMKSKSFAENPLGVDFDPEELVQQLRNGDDQNVIKKCADIGPRGLDTFPPEFFTVPAPAFPSYQSKPDCSVNCRFRMKY